MGKLVKKTNAPPSVVIALGSYKLLTILVSLGSHNIPTLKIGYVPYHPSVLRKVICIRAKFHPSQQLVFIGALVHPYASAKVES